MNRREAIKRLTASTALFSFAPYNLASSSVKTEQAEIKQKCLWIILRGGMDGLSVIRPSTAQDIHRLSRLRPSIFPQNKQWRYLTKDYQINSHLSRLKKRYNEQNLSLVLGATSLQGQRSHFRAQDILESGRDNNFQSGWLGRLAVEVNKSAYGIASKLPLSLQATRVFDTWFPNGGKEELDEQLIAQLKQLYERHPKQLEKLNTALVTDASLSGLSGSEDDTNKRADEFSEQADAAGYLLANNHAHFAFLEMGGWDTHSNQQNRLEDLFDSLDKGLATLKAVLETCWDDTLIIIASEFGRTVEENGSAGTDHGTGSHLFFTGGNIEPNIHGNIPPLVKANLYQNRDLPANFKSIDVISDALGQHFGLTPEQMSKVFPDAGLSGLQIVKSA